MPLVDIATEGLMDLTSESCFDFEISNKKIRLTIKPLDQKITQLYVSVKIQTSS